MASFKALLTILFIFNIKDSCGQDMSICNLEGSIKPYTYRCPSSIDDPSKIHCCGYRNDPRCCDTGEYDKFIKFINSTNTQSPTPYPQDFGTSTPFYARTTRTTSRYYDSEVYNTNNNGSAYPSRDEHLSAAGFTAARLWISILIPLSIASQISI